MKRGEESCFKPWFFVIIKQTSFAALHSCCHYRTQVATNGRLGLLEVDKQLRGESEWTVFVELDLPRKRRGALGGISSA